jgi:SpoVK/Ycf46/Vps4 family AAA+-type ATPase
MSCLNNFQNNLIDHIRAGGSCFCVQTAEQLRLDRLLSDCAKVMCSQLREWNLGYGWVGFVNKQPLKPLDSGQTPSLAQALSDLRDEDLDGWLIVIKNARLALEHDKTAISRLQLLLHRILRHHEGRAAVILVSEHLDLPQEIEALTTPLSLPLPSRDDISGLLNELLQQHKLKMADELRTPVCNAFAGLTYQQISKVIALVHARHKTLDTEAMKLILREKEAIIGNSGVLEMVKTGETIDDIGGLENLKTWLNERAQLISRISDAEAFGIAPPKGVLIVGMPGCGKSLTAKVAASLFRLPLLRLDIGSLLGKYVGESEHNMRRALTLTETVSPCILWVDELEKAFVGMGSDHASEVTSRLLGYFLTWMQEKIAATFVIATANDISKLPPELLRKGRFDEIFYVGFPNTSERGDILRIQLNHAKQNAKKFDLSALSARCRNFTGADIHNAVNAALESAFLKRQVFGQLHLEVAIDATVPLRETMCEKVGLYEAKFEELKLRSATRNDGMDIAQMVKWAEDPNHVRREKVARNPDCPADLLEKLIQDSEESVQIAVLKNSSCPENVLALVLNYTATPENDKRDGKQKERDETLQRHVIDHLNTPKDLVLDLFQKKRLQLTQQQQIQLCRIAKS